MKLLNLFKAFEKNEPAAADVGGVALSAKIVDLGKVIMTQLGGSITGLGDAIIAEPAYSRVASKSLPRSE